MPVHEDPKDIRPEDVQEIYPFGERCPDPIGHRAHYWRVLPGLGKLVFPLPEVDVQYDNVRTLHCNGHDRCGVKGWVAIDTVTYPTTCHLTQHHDEAHKDEIWGEFPAPETLRQDPPS